MTRRPTCKVSSIFSFAIYTALSQAKLIAGTTEGASMNWRWLFERTKFFFSWGFFCNQNGLGSLRTPTKVNPQPFKRRRGSYSHDAHTNTHSKSRKVRALDPHNSFLYRKYSGTVNLYFLTSCFTAVKDDVLLVVKDGPHFYHICNRRCRA